MPNKALFQYCLLRKVSQCLKFKLRKIRIRISAESSLISVIINIHPQEHKHKRGRRKFYPND